MSLRDLFRLGFRVRRLGGSGALVAAAVRGAGADPGVSLRVAFAACYASAGEGVR